jgi:endoglycosylceramidase
MRAARTVVLVVAVLVALAPGVARGDEPSESATSSGLPWLRVGHVAGARAEITDRAGRTVILRGVNVAGLEDDFYRAPDGSAAGPGPFWPVDPSAYVQSCPANSNRAGQPPVCEVQAGLPEYEQSAADTSQNDLAQMRALGFNVIRLPVSWSLLEPTPGDGIPAQAVGGQAPFNAYVEASFTSFWLNRVPSDPQTGAALPRGQAPGPGLQDHYIGAIAQLAEHFKDDSTVVGYEIMNEPLPGFIPFPGPFDQGYLYPFYRRVIDAVTGVRDGISCPTGISYTAACGYRSLGIHDRRHLFFFEPMAIRNVTDFSVGISAPFSSYRNLVYAPHAYTHVFTADTNVPGGQAPRVYPVSYDQALQTADLEARLMRAALFVGEYGNASANDNDILAKETAAQDRATAGSTHWLWKSNCSPVGSCWGVYAGASPAENGPMVATRQQYLSRVYPRSTAGVLSSYSYDAAQRTFTMSASSRRSVRLGRRDRETVVYIPSTVSGQVTVSGATVLDGVVTNPDQSRLAYAAPTGTGTYTISVG